MAPLAFSQFRSMRWISRTLAGAALLTSLVCVGPAAAQPAAGSKAGHHIYCIRGIFNVFSLGMDEVCDKLAKMGLNATTHNHAVWASIAADAAASYKAGRERTIILIGHSAGAGAVADIAGRLAELNVPVKLAVALDCIWGTTASGHVEQYVNYYVEQGSGKRVAKGPRFSGVLRNIDLSKRPNIGHMNIDKDPVVQQMVIGHVRSALARAAAPKPEQAPAPAPTHSGSPPQATTGSASRSGGAPAIEQ